MAERAVHVVRLGMLQVPLARPPVGDGLEGGAIRYVPHLLRLRCCTIHEGRPHADFVPCLGITLFHHHPPLLQPVHEPHELALAEFGVFRQKVSVTVYSVHQITRSLSQDLLRRVQRCLWDGDLRGRLGLMWCMTLVEMGMTGGACLEVGRLWKSCRRVSLPRCNDRRMALRNRS